MDRYHLGSVANKSCFFSFLPPERRCVIGINDSSEDERYGDVPTERVSVKRKCQCGKEFYVSPDAARDVPEGSEYDICRGCYLETVAAGSQIIERHGLTGWVANWAKRTPE